MRPLGILGGVLATLTALVLVGDAAASAALADPDVAVVYVSTSSAGWIDGVAFEDEDIIAFDVESASWSLVFDGSDVGLENDDLTGLHIVDATADLPRILLTVQRGLDIDGIGAVDDSDIVQFSPTSLGVDTAGTFTRLLDGSSVGLTTTSEDIDAITATADGHLVISTSGSPRVTHRDGSQLSGRDEDLLVLDQNGRFDWYFDGSDVDFGGGDTSGAWLDPSSGSIALSGKGGIDVDGLTAADNDIASFAGTFGGDTSGVFSALAEGGPLGLVGLQIDGLHVVMGAGAGVPTTTTTLPTSAPPTTAPTTTMPATTSPPTSAPPLDADISVSITRSDDIVDVAEPASYELSVLNAGPGVATDVILTTRLPDGLQLVSTSGCREDPNGRTCSLGNLAAGATKTMTVRVATEAGTRGVQTISAGVGSAVNDPDLADNATEVSTAFVERPIAADDGVADTLRTATDTPLAGLSLVANDNRGEPVATITSFGGGDLGGTVATHAAGETVDVDAGSLTVFGDGTFDFEPADGFIGSLRFDYRLTNVVGSDDASVTIGVGPIPIPPREAIVYLSTTSAGTIGDIEFEDEDILAYDFVSDSWTLFFDGSDLDLGRRDIDGFHIIDSGEPLPSILLTLDNPLGVAGFGFVDDSDILRFEPTSLGEDTAGTFDLMLDGSTVGLDAGAEDVDAIVMTGDGQLLLSTSGDVSIPGRAGAALTATSSDILSIDSDGGVSVAFDGTAFGENLTAAWLDPQTDHLHAAFRRGVSAQGLDGDNDDVFVFPFHGEHEGPRLVGTLFDGSTHGLERDQIDGLSVHYRQRAASAAPPVITSNGGGDVASISIAENTAPPGTLVWGSGVFGASQEQLRSAEAVDAAGNVVSTGFFQGTIDVDPGSESLELDSAGSFDVFVSKLDADGDLVWAWALGGPNNDRGAGVSTDVDGNVYLTGYFQGTVDFDPGEEIVELTAAGVEDVFVAKYDRDGTLLWARQFGGDDDILGSGIGVDASGNLVSVDDFVTDVDAIDRDGDDESGGLAYRFTTFASGVDNDRFEIDPRTGLISFTAAPDFESPVDANRDNVYEIEVTVADARGLVDTQRLTVTVTDIAEDS